MNQLRICILRLISKLVHLIPASCNFDSTLMDFSKLLPLHICNPASQVSKLFTHSPIFTPVYLFARLLDYISRQSSLHKIDAGYRTFFFTLYKALPRHLRSLLYYTNPKSRENLQTFVIRLKG